MENKCSDAELFSFCRAALLCSDSLLLLLCFCFLIFIPPNIPSALPSVCSAPSFLQTFRLLSSSFLPSLLQKFIPLSALLFLLSALLDGGCLPFFDKNRFFIPPPKNSRHFFKKASPLLIFNTAYT